MAHGLEFEPVPTCDLALVRAYQAMIRMLTNEVGYQDRKLKTRVCAFLSLHRKELERQDRLRDMGIQTLVRHERGRAKSGRVHFVR